MIFSDPLDWLAFAWFFASWGGYTLYARWGAKKHMNSLSALLYRYRIEWAKAMMRHEIRVPDLLLLGNLVQMVNFMATTTIFVLAGLITILYSSDSIMALLESHAFVAPTTQERVQFKLLVLVFIFVFAFFRFTWAMRQHSFCSILIGSAPLVTGKEMTEDELQFAIQLAKISDRAGHEFNYGLRSYYFALAFLSWFISPVVFMVFCTMIVAVLYRREYRSQTLNYMMKTNACFARMNAKKHAALVSNL